MAKKERAFGPAAADTANVVAESFEFVERKQSSKVLIERRESVQLPQVAAHVAWETDFVPRLEALTSVSLAPLPGDSP